MEIKVVRSKRYSYAVQVNMDGSVTVKAPLRATEADIERVLKEKDAWIRRTIRKMEVTGEAMRERYGDVADTSNPTPEEVQELVRRAKEYLPGRVAFFAERIGVTYGRITIRHQQTRWGSCSSMGNLNFNCMLMKLPPNVIDYVVVHELCHRKHMDHSRAFWQEVERAMPEYREAERALKAYHL